MKYILTAAFAGTVIGANLALAEFGIINIGFGLAAPAGVLFAGLAFGLRDALHETGGSRWVLAAILAGAIISFIIEDAVTIPGGLAPIAVASAAAFALSELLDFAIYAPLRERSWSIAVIASNIAGSVADSILFLTLAFGSIDYLTGQVVGKTYMIVLALPIVWAVRRAVSRHTINIAGA